MEAALTDDLQNTGFAADAGKTEGFEAGGAVSQFISFTVGEEQYAVDIMSVREIKGWTAVTTLPNQPDYVRGVMNLRGIVVPIIDLRSRFGGPSTDATPIHVVIIMNVGERIIGLLVDAVSDILSINDNQIKDVPAAGQKSESQFLRGIITINEEMVALLSVDKLVEEEEFNQITPE